MNASGRARAWLAQADLLFLLAETLRPAAPRSGAAPAPALEPDAARDLARAARLGPQVASALRALASARSEEDPALRGEELLRLFDAPGDCPPNETAWVRRDKGAILGDIAGFYAAFGFQAAARSHEKADHVVAELEYAALLLAMRARAELRGETDRERITAEALRRFAADHAGDWLPAFAERLHATARSRVLAAGAVLLASAWEALARVHRWDAAPPAATPAEADGTPYECDLASGEESAARYQA